MAELVHGRRTLLEPPESTFARFLARIVDSGYDLAMLVFAAIETPDEADRDIVRVAEGYAIPTSRAGG